MRPASRAHLAILLALGMMLAGAAVQAFAGALPAPPEGFTVKPGADPLKAKGLADRIEATKPNANWPTQCAADPKIDFTYGWTTIPGGATVIQMMVNAPEEPASNSGFIKDEPAGKSNVAGGVMVWRKETTTLIGVNGNGCKMKEIVTYHGSWMGYVGDNLNGKMVAIGVWHVYAKETGQALITAYIEKVKAAAQ